jgi:hypothetical protein
MGSSPTSSTTEKKGNRAERLVYIGLCVSHKWVYGYGTERLKYTAQISELQLILAFRVLKFTYKIF